MKMIMCSAILISVLSTGVNALGNNEQVKKGILDDEAVFFKAPFAELKCIPTHREKVTLSRIHPLVFPHEEQSFLVNRIKGNSFESSSDGLVQLKVPSHVSLKMHAKEVAVRGNLLITSAVGKSISIRGACFTDNAHIEARTVQIRSTSEAERLSITADSIKLRETAATKIELHQGAPDEWRLQLRDIQAEEIAIDAPSDSFMIMRIRLTKWNPLPKLNFLNKEVKGIIAVSGQNPETIETPAGVHVYKCGYLYKIKNKTSAQIFKELDKRMM